MKVNDFGNLTGRFSRCPNNRKWLNIMRYITLEELLFWLPSRKFISTKIVASNDVILRTFIIGATIPYDDGLLWQSWTRLTYYHFDARLCWMFDNYAHSELKTN
ncbi:unnamed protein product [Rhizophagus irregularis]|nr:unnamed protein product [Rhizophagus irregularis]